MLTRDDWKDRIVRYIADHWMGVRFPEIKSLGTEHLGDSEVFKMLRELEDEGRIEVIRGFSGSYPTVEYFPKEKD